MRKLSKISMYTSALIVEVMVAISPGSISDMQLHLMNDLGNLLVFFKTVFFIGFIWTKQKF